MLVVQLVWWDGALWLARAVIAFAMSFAGSLWRLDVIPRLPH